MDNSGNITFDTGVRRQAVVSNALYSNSGAARFILKYFGWIIKTEEQATYVVFGISLIILIVSVYTSAVMISGQRSHINTLHPVYQEDLTPELRKSLSPEVLSTIPYKNEK